MRDRGAPERFFVIPTEIKTDLIDEMSRDDIPALLSVLQRLWVDSRLRTELFALPVAHVALEHDHDSDRPGMML